ERRTGAQAIATAGLPSNRSRAAKLHRPPCDRDWRFYRRAGCISESTAPLNARGFTRRAATNGRRRLRRVALAPSSLQRPRTETLIAIEVAAGRDNDAPYLQRALPRIAPGLRLGYVELLDGALEAIPPCEPHCIE